MRRYVFTKMERGEVLRWLRTGERTPRVNRIVFEVNENRNVLLADFRLLVEVLKKYDAGY